MIPAEIRTLSNEPVFLNNEPDENEDEDEDEYEEAGT